MARRTGEDLLHDDRAWRFGLPLFGVEARPVVVSGSVGQYLVMLVGVFC